MIASKQIDPPVQFRPEGIGELVIGVRILVVPDVLAPIFTPEQNRIGTQILCRLLQAGMELAGVRVTETSRGFALNRAFYMFTVSELAPAQDAIKGELEKVGLLEWAQVAWRDPREEVWRVWYSKSGRFESPSDEELATETEIWDRLISAVKKSQQSEDEPPGQ